MRHRSSVVLIAFWILGSLGAAETAQAHDKWLEVEPFHSAAPSPAKVYLLTGEALQQAELVPLRRAASVRRFQLVSPPARRPRALSRSGGA
ncbi:MAG: hypothetical protein U1A78_41435 [Polyangia bacterium]